MADEMKDAVRSSVIKRRDGRITVVVHLIAFEPDKLAGLAFSLGNNSRVPALIARIGRSIYNAIIDGFRSDEKEA